jgi:hypothetical protein
VPKIRQANGFAQSAATVLGRLAAAASAKKSNCPPIQVAETPAPENLKGERKTVTALNAAGL